MPQVSKFTNNQGVRRLSSLFAEMCKTKQERKNSVYTLKDYHYTLGDYYRPSLYVYYMECRDPLEYTFANTYLCDWQHWETLCNCEWFKPYVERWRHELDLALRSEALAKMIKTSEGDTRDSVSAAKYILEKGWSPKETKGRPSKQQIKERANEIAEEQKSVNEQFERLGLSSGILRNARHN